MTMSQRRECFILAALLLCAGPAVADALEGRLLLADGAAARGYVVSVVGSTISVPCDAAGQFLLDPAPVPPFALVATGGDGKIAGPFEVTALPSGLLELVVPPELRESVTVISGVAPTLERAAANAATVVTREELEQRAPQRLVNVLESVAGASKLGEGADSVPALRNLSRGRTLILIDGARVSAERRAGPSATFLDPESLGSVEVVRGPGSVVYGSDAFGGVINAVTRDPEPTGWGARFSLEGSAEALDGAAAYGAGFTELGGGSLLFDGHWRTADDAEAGEGIPIENSSFDAFGGGARYLREVGPGQLRLALAIDRVEDLGKAAIDSAQIRAVYPEENSDRISASWLGTPGGGWELLEGLVAYDAYDLLLERDRVPTPTSNRRIDSSDTDARDAAMRGLAARPLAGGRLRLGLDVYSRFDLHAITGRTDFAADATTVVRETETVSIDEANQLTTGVFATWNGTLTGPLSLEVGLRGDAVEARNRGGYFGDHSESDSAGSGNLALTWATDGGWTTSAQVARGFRSPTLSDRYFRGPSGRGFVTGNPALEPETSLQYDLSTRFARGRHAGGLYAYRYVIDDLIERYTQGADFFFRNRGEATIDGVELEVQTAFGAGWSGELGAAWADGETDDGGEVDDIAAPNGWVSLRWSWSAGYLLGRVTAFADHDEPGPNELARDGETLLDLGAGWQVLPAIEVRAMVRNVTDELYTGAPDNAADRSPGRSFTFGVSGTF